MINCNSEKKYSAGDGAFAVVIPKSAENLQLPDLDLVRLWKEEEDRIINIDGAIDDFEDPSSVLSLDVVKKIIRYNKEDALIPPEERTPIKLYIDSVGGSMDGTYTIMNTISLSKTPVYTINLGTAASAAGLILSCGHKRLALPGTSVLVHSGSVGYNGVREQVESAKKYFDGMDKKVVDLFISKTKIDQKTYKNKASKDWWMDEAEALKYGIIDKIVDDISEVF